MAMDQAVIELAMTQGGIATRAQLTGMQKSLHWIDREVAAGRLQVVKTGVYRVVAMTDHGMSSAPPPWRCPRQL